MKKQLIWREENGRIKAVVSENECYEVYQLDNGKFLCTNFTGQGRDLCVLRESMDEAKLCAHFHFDNLREAPPRKETATIEWHYLPELPEDDTEVLLAFEYGECPVQAKCSGSLWYASDEVLDSMVDDFDGSSVLEIHSRSIPYAWAYMPENPEF